MPKMAVFSCLTRVLPDSKDSKRDTLEIGSDFVMEISIRLSGAHLLLKTS